MTLNPPRRQRRGPERGSWIICSSDFSKTKKPLRLDEGNAVKRSADCLSCCVASAFSYNERRVHSVPKSYLTSEVLCRPRSRSRKPKAPPNSTSWTDLLFIPLS